MWLFVFTITFRICAHMGERPYTGGGGFLGYCLGAEAFGKEIFWDMGKFHLNLCSDKRRVMTEGGQEARIRLEKRLEFFRIEDFSFYFCNFRIFDCALIDCTEGVFDSVSEGLHVVRAEGEGF